MMTMELSTAARQLAQLGHATRLGIHRELVKAGPSGLAVSEIQQALAVPASTLSHHLNHLVQAGLIKQTRQGRVLQCHAQFDVLNDLVTFLVEQCCKQSMDDPCC